MKSNLRYLIIRGGKYSSFVLKRNNLFLSLLFIVILFNTCRKDEGCPPIRDEYFTFYRDALRNIKYNEHDTLIFESEKGEQFTFIGSGQIDSGYSQRWAETAGDCLYVRKNEKYYNIVFKSKDYKSDLIAGVFYAWGIQCFGFQINNTDYFVKNNLPNYPNSFYLDSILINGNTYEKVYKIFKDYSNEYISIFTYYSKKEGVIQINFPDGIKLTKIK